VIDVEELAERVTPLVLSAVLAKLAGALGAALETPFSTRRGAAVPAEFIGRAKKWREVAPSIPGAVRVGRWWTVDRGCYGAWVRSQSTVPAAPAAGAQARMNDAPWSAISALRAAGLRPTR
jgi:hypothetical protein